MKQTTARSPNKVGSAQANRDGSRKPKSGETFARGAPRKDAQALAPPRWLDRTGKRVWRHIAGRLFRAGVVSDLDSAVLLSYCQLSAQQETVAREILAGDSSPELRHEQRKINNDLLRIATALALTPLARHRVAMRPAMLDEPQADAQRPDDAVASRRERDRGPDLLELVRAGDPPGGR